MDKERKDIFTANRAKGLDLPRKDKEGHHIMIQDECKKKMSGTS